MLRFKRTWRNLLKNANMSLDPPIDVLNLPRTESKLFEQLLVGGGCGVGAQVRDPSKVLLT